MAAVTLERAASGVKIDKTAIRKMLPPKTYFPPIFSARMPPGNWVIM